MEQYCNRWASLVFDTVPPVEEAQRLASYLRQDVTNTDGGVDLERCCVLARAEVRETPLGSRRGGREALLVPLPDARFRIVVDTDLTSLTDASHRLSVSRRRRRFRIAHELGHTLFYVRQFGRPARQLRIGTREEEDFCDEFARCLLAPPPARALRAPGVLDLQERCDVSLEVAARSAASAPSGPSVALWWWPVGRGGVLKEQWASHANFSDELGVTPYRTQPRDLGSRLKAAQERLGEALSFVLLADRGQALATLAPS